jgi:DNA-binding transcriptional regulator YdaS (Cro superfamily)
MKLADWLTQAKVKRGDFARRVGISQQHLTGLCKDARPSLALALAIERETDGAVKPADFVRETEA